LLPATSGIACESRWLGTFRALRHRNFRLFWSGQIVSLTGTWMQIVAQGWLVYRLTDSPLMLGLVNVVGLLPVVPVSLLAGAISDRVSRRALIMSTEALLALQALAMAVLTWLGVIQVWHVILLSFVLGFAGALEQPARLAFVVDTVGKEDLTNAVALNAAVQNGARIVGPSIAGLAVAWIGEAGCFGINAVTYLAVIAALAAVRLPGREAAREQPGLTRSLIDGLRYVWRERTIRGLMGIVALSSFLALSYITLLPAFAGDVLGLGPEGLGFLMTGVGVGAICGSIAIAGAKEGRRGRWLMAAHLVSSAALIVFCMARSLPLSVALIVLVGAGSAVRNTLANGLLQLNARDEYQSRVMSVYNLLFNGMSRVGALGVGGMAQLTGVAWAVGLAAASSVLWGLIAIARMPQVHRLA
jgi:MFS family permease